MTADIKASILVVEDSKFFSSLVCKEVRKRVDADVTAAMSYAETCQAVMDAPNEHFDLALVDLVLPDAPNGEAVDWLLGLNIPCVVFTGIFSEDMRERLLSQNVIDYIVKDTPSSLDYLMNLVERMHRNRNTKAMVVDDSRLARQLTAKLLRNYQFTVLEAEDGLKALKMLETHPDIKLVVTDYHMPEMDGVEMVKRMRQTHDQDQLAIIGISSGGGSALSAKFIKYGANDYINKPYLPEEFFCRVMQNMRVLEMVQSLTELATIDALTGIHNRRFFMEAGEKMFANALRKHLDLAVAIIDLDNFKSINDTFGHDAGDVVLQRVAALLRESTRQADIMARFGGEEFAFLASNLDPEGAQILFEKLRQRIEAEEIEYEGQRIPITASFGVCLKHEANLDSTVKKADEMLYLAKNNGRNRIEISP